MTPSRPGVNRTKFLLFAFAALVPFSHAQTTMPGLSTSGALVRLQVRPYADKPREGLDRKRLYLIKGSLSQNRTLIENLTAKSLPTRDCFYTNAGASRQFIAWLKENDCESVYCMDIDDKYLEGEKAVPEFREAFAVGLKEYGNAEVAKKWLTVNVPDVLRNGFYLTKQKELQALLGLSQNATADKVLSVMTDRKGTAYLANVPAGDYVISSLAPIELETTSILFNCELTVKSDDLGTEKQMRINKQNKKCVVIEKPLPDCMPASVSKR